MRRQPEEVPLRPQTQQFGAPQRSVFQIKRLPRRPTQNILYRICLGNSIQVRQVRHRQRNGIYRCFLPRRLVIDGDASGAQREIAAEQNVRAGLQPRDVQRAIQFYGAHDVLGGVAGIQLIQEPGALPRRRQRLAHQIGNGGREGRSSHKGIPVRTRL